MARPSPFSATASFRADAALQRGERAENADYAGSGYDKGHMAPANDFTRSVAAMNTSPSAAMSR